MSWPSIALYCLKPNELSTFRQKNCIARTLWFSGYGFIMGVSVFKRRPERLSDGLAQRSAGLYQRAHSMLWGGAVKPVRS